MATSAPPWPPAPPATSRSEGQGGGERGEGRWELGAARSSPRAGSRAGSDTGHALSMVSYEVAQMRSGLAEVAQLRIGLAEVAQLRIGLAEERAARFELERRLDQLCARQVPAAAALSLAASDEAVARCALATCSRLVEAAEARLRLELVAQGSEAAASAGCAMDAHEVHRRSQQIIATAVESLSTVEVFAAHQQRQIEDIFGAMRVLQEALGPDAAAPGSCASKAWVDEHSRNLTERCALLESKLRAVSEQVLSLDAGKAGKAAAAAGASPPHSAKGPAAQRTGSLEPVAVHPSLQVSLAPPTLRREGLIPQNHVQKSPLQSRGVSPFGSSPRAAATATASDSARGHSAPGGQVSARLAAPPPAVGPQAAPCLAAPQGLGLSWSQGQQAAGHGHGSVPPTVALRPDRGHASGPALAVGGGFASGASPLHGMPGRMSATGWSPPRATMAPPHTITTRRSLVSIRQLSMEI